MRTAAALLFAFAAGWTGRGVFQWHQVTRFRPYRR